MSWWQLSNREWWMPEFKNKFGWSVNLKSMQLSEFSRKCVGLSISWLRSRLSVSSFNSMPSAFSSPSAHHLIDLQLKSPVITKQWGLVSLILVTIVSKPSKKSPNSWEVWLDDRYKTTRNIFFLPLVISATTHSLIVWRSILCLIGIFSL